MKVNIIWKEFDNWILISIIIFILLILTDIFIINRDIINIYQSIIDNTKILSWIFLFLVFNIFVILIGLLFYSIGLDLKEKEINKKD